MLIHIHIYPEAKEEKIIQKRETSYDVYVKEEARENKANRRMLQMLSVHFDIPPGRIRIITGHHAPSKIIEVPDVPTNTG